MRTKDDEDKDQQSAEFSVRIINGYPRVSASRPISVCNGSEARVSKKIGQRKNSMPSNGPKQAKIQNRDDFKVKSGFSNNPNTAGKARTLFSGVSSTADSVGRMMQ